MQIKLITVGKAKSKAIAELSQDYIQRIQKFYRFELIEIPESSISPHTPMGTALEKQSLKIKKNIRDRTYLVVLDETGEQYSSTELASEIQKIFNRSFDEITFVIGGAYGLAASLKDQAQKRLSLSKLTLPHQLARVLTLEQIYRALTILKGTPYHHE